MSKIEYYHKKFRVYYEDTDAGGVVYYARYLQFAERARTEMLREMGVNQSELASEYGVYFVVSQVHVDYRSPAALDDVLQIRTHIKCMGRSFMDISQEIFIDDSGDMAALVEVKIAAVKKSDKGGFKPCGIPDKIRRLQEAHH